MNKIRLYDLSKELNLENKEILDICEALNIEVKSHSTTVNELEVKRIKEAAYKYRYNFNYLDQKNYPIPIVNFSIKGFRRLQDIDLKMKRLTVLIGANGAGKTSFLDILSLVLASARGDLKTAYNCKED